MVTLSLAMIVRDEAGALGHCLGSVRDLVDEMVVVDTGSTDGTVAIAESFGARTGSFPWRDDFAAARNESLRLCTGDWVLLLDADEAVDRLDHGLIRKAIEHAGPTLGGYTLISRNYTRDGSARLFGAGVRPNQGPYGEGAEFPFHADQPMLRLVRRLPDLRFEGRIHERLDRSLARNHLGQGALEAVIHHFGKLDGTRERAKSAYYLDLAQREAAEHPLDPDLQFNLMAQAEVAGLWDKVLAAGLAVTRLSPRVPYAVPLTIALAYQQLGRHLEALPPLAQVLRDDPGHLTALCRQATSMAALGRPEEARSDLARAMAAHPEEPMPCLVLGDLEERAGRPAEARAAVAGAIGRQPAAPQLRQALIELDLRLQMEAQAAADAMEALRALPGQGGGLWHALAAGFLLKSGHVRPGQAVLDLGLGAFPDHGGLLGLAAALAANTPDKGVEVGGMRFNMGCGNNKRAGFTNVDQSPACAPDQVVDLEVMPWPWADDSAEEVVFNHCLEHMGGDPKVFLSIIKELYRVCRPDALVTVAVPHPRHDNFIGDPTHVRIISPQVMALFDRKENDRWAAMGASNTPLAQYLGVDFEITASTVELDEPYRTQLGEGRLSQDQVLAALRDKNNVATEYRIQLRARKPSR